jgi:hypothetical protein
VSVRRRPHLFSNATSKALLDQPSTIMDVFNAPSIGSPRALASRAGNTAGTSTDIIYPVSRLTHGSFSNGKTLEFNFRSDKHRHVLLRSSRLVVHMEHVFGEVDTTAESVVNGPRDASIGCRPSKSIMYATLPGTTLFGTGQARYVLNSVVVTNQNHLLDSSLVQLLLTTNNDGPSTSGSNMMTSTRKDTGLAAPSYFYGSERASTTENFSLLPVTIAPYLLGGTDGTAKVAITNDTKLAALKDSATGEFEAYECFIVSGGAANATTFVISDADALHVNPEMIVTVTTPGTANAAISKSGGGDISIASVAKITDEDDEEFGNYLVTLESGASFGASGSTTVSDSVTDTSLVLTQLKFESKGSDANIELVSFSRIAEAFAIKMKASASKMTTPNPRVEILQQGFNETTGIVTTQTSEPLLLDTWNTPYAIGPADHALFLSVSPDWQKNLFYDMSGQYGCLEGDGGIINCKGDGSDDFPSGAGSIKARQIYSRVTSIALHVHYVHPSEPYIPKSLSLRVSPVQVITRQMKSRSVLESFVVSPSIKSCMIFIRQNAQHVCIDRSELSLAAAGINVLGNTNPKGTGVNHVANSGGCYLYDSKAIADSRDPELDPRRPSGKASVDLVHGRERTAPYCFESLQVQCGGAIQPREALSEMAPHGGKMSRAWQLYTEFIGRAAGMRAAPLSYSEFCGTYNSNFASAPRAGDRGCFFLFDLQQKPGSLASTLEVRGLLEQEPDIAAKQELVVVCVSDSIMNIGYQAPSETPVLTEIQPVIGA